MSVQLPLPLRIRAANPSLMLIRATDCYGDTGGRCIRFAFSWGGVPCRRVIPHWVRVTKQIEEDAEAKEKLG